jgi:hypothetical protein
MVIVRTGYPRLLAGVASWLVLAACPQLMSDEFRVVTGDAATGPTPPLDRDAGDRDAGDRDAGDRDASSTPPVDALRAALAHRYDLAGAGNTAADSVGDADGFVWNTVLGGQGFVRLIGTDQYVSLPNGLLSSSNDKTLEAWLTWRGGLDGQHIFDFGISNLGELNQGSGVSYLFLAASDQGPMAVAFSTNGAAAEVRLNGTVPLPRGTLTHVAVVIDSGRDTLSLYLNGTPHATTPLLARLASISDLNMWIGRSQDAGDPSLDADVTEFRIYDQPLDADQVALSYRLGPDIPFAAP